LVEKTKYAKDRPVSEIIVKGEIWREGGTCERGPLIGQID